MTDESNPQSEVQVNDIFVGVIDAIFALGVTLANAGVIERKTLAENMGRVLQAQAAQWNIKQGPHHLPSRQLAAKTLQDLFSAEVVSGLRVIDGDKKPEA